MKRQRPDLQRRQTSLTAFSLSKTLVNRSYLPLLSVPLPMVGAVRQGEGGDISTGTRSGPPCHVRRCDMQACKPTVRQGEQGLASWRCCGLVDGDHPRAKRWPYSNVLAHRRPACDALRREQVQSELSLVLFGALAAGRVRAALNRSFLSTGG